MKGEPWAGVLSKPVSRAADKKKRDREKDTHWQTVRKAVLVRDHWRCRACGTADHVEVHHVRFRSLGGTDSTNNCAVLCKSCHCEIHAYRLYVEGEDANKRMRFVRVK